MKSIVKTMPGRRLTWFGLGALLFLPMGLARSEPTILMAEDFDSGSDSRMAAVLLEAPQTNLATGQGPDGSDALRVAYVGYEQGSQRITKIFNLPGAYPSATLSYDVRFEEGFQFVKGGKLHGFSPEVPVTGGQNRTPRGWSARVVFKKGGHTGAYNYDQNPDKKWGVGGSSREQVFFPGCWHHVDLQVQLNDPGQANGWTRIFVDGHEVVNTGGIVFRSQGGSDTLIQKFLFATFHGGSTPDCAPVDENGNFKTVYAWFDNFLITEGIQEIHPVSCTDN